MPAKIYGHRGARGERPENTLEAFAYAVTLGVDGLETDIALTADLVPVLHHNPELADGQLVKNVAFADLPGHVPSLAEALAAHPETRWLLEIKTFPTAPQKTHPITTIVQKTLDVLVHFDPSYLRIMAFEWAVLREVAARAPPLGRVCLTAPDMAAARDIWWGPGFQGLDIPNAVAASGALAWSGLHKVMTQAEVTEARRLGLDVFAWTVNDLAEASKILDIVDIIITDYPKKIISNNP